MNEELIGKFKQEIATEQQTIQYLLDTVAEELIAGRFDDLYQEANKCLAISYRRLALYEATIARLLAGETINVI